MIAFLVSPRFGGGLRRVFIGSLITERLDVCASNDDLMSALMLWGIAHILPTHTHYGFHLTNGNKSLEISINSGAWTGTGYEPKKTRYFDFVTVQSLVKQLDWLLETDEQ